MALKTNMPYLTTSTYIGQVVLRLNRKMCFLLCRNSNLVDKTKTLPRTSPHPNNESLTMLFSTNISILSIAKTLPPHWISAKSLASFIMPMESGCSVSPSRQYQFPLWTPPMTCFLLALPACWSLFDALLFHLQCMHRHCL